MITVVARIRAVYYAANERRAGRRRGRLTKAAAYRDAAWAAWWAKHPCECERDDETSHYVACRQHQRDGELDHEGQPTGARVLDPEMSGRRWNTIVRLARWLRWRDTKSTWARDKKRSGLACPKCRERVGLEWVTAKHAAEELGVEAFDGFEPTDPIFYEGTAGWCGACGTSSVVAVDEIGGRAWLRDTREP